MEKKSTPLYQCTLISLCVCVFHSHPCWGSEAKPKSGTPPHMPWWPYWIFGRLLATSQHLHGPSFSAVRQGGHWKRQRANRPIKLTQWRPAQLQRPLHPGAKKTQNTTTTTATFSDRDFQLFIWSQHRSWIQITRLFIHFFHSLLFLRCDM